MDEYPCSVKLPCGHWITAELPRETGPTLFQYHCPIDGWMDGYEALVWHPAFRPKNLPWSDVNSDPIADIKKLAEKYRVMTGTPPSVIGLPMVVSPALRKKIFEAERERARLAPVYRSSIE